MLLSIIRLEKFTRVCIKTKVRSVECRKNIHSLYPKITYDNQPLDEFVWEKLHKWENKTALVCTTTKRSYSYKEAYKMTNALAKFLHKFHKIKQLDRILIVLPNVPEYPIISLGAIRAGLIVATANPFYTAEEISKRLINCTPKIIFTINDLYPTIQNALNIAKQEIPVVIIKTRTDELIPRETIDFKSILDGSPKLDFQIERNLNDTIFLLYSSGTTGIPKGVELSHKNIINNLHQMEFADVNVLTEADELNQEVLPAILPMYHCYGLILTLLNGLRHGCNIPTISKFQSDSFINALDEYLPTVMHTVPPILLFLINNPHIKKDSLLRLKTIISGAAPLGASDILRFHRKTGNKIQVLQAYGLTECSPLTHMQSSCIPNGIKIGGIGNLIPSTECCIVSVEDGTQQLANQPGELLIRGPQVMKGYYNNPKDTNNSIVNGWLQTGDVGYFDEDGHFFITDRIKEMIKVKGYQVAPAELEELLRDHPDVEDAAVIGVPHEKFGEVPKAFIVTKSNLKIKETDIEEYISRKVSQFKQLLGGVEFIKEIPKSPSGKILRRSLKNA